MESDTSDANDSKRSCISEAWSSKRLCESDSRPGKRLCAPKDEFGNYDVFISHRGSNTKIGFVNYLYEALKRAGLHPFWSCISIGTNQDAWKCIDHAIKTTPIALVIFSDDFTQSEWCLKELHAILASPSMKVLSIFYYVHPWEVRFIEKGQLAVGFLKLTKRHDTSITEEWRIDLERASKLNGWQCKEEDKRSEKDLVLEVVGKIFELANKPLSLNVGDHIVGVKQVVEYLIKTIDEKKVFMLGLWGMGGIGKSTLARELYNQLGQRFDARCYVEDVVQMVNQGGVMIVQNHILKTLCENEVMQYVSKSKGKVILEERLSQKPILLVFDDVREYNQMDYLLSRKMLKEGSLCIVTSRDRRIFEESTSFHINHDVYIHDVQLLSQQDSRSLFACHAFGGDWKVPQKFEGLVGDVSMACGGVPLVLKVCGSLLRNEEDVGIWKEVLRKLNCGSIIEERRIFECLRISYDSLEEQDQEMFLDIACALLGASVEMAKLVWRSQGWSARLGVRSLVEKALIRVDEHGAFCMHDHLRNMGCTIARQESKSLGIYKRLWGFESSALLKKNESLPGSLQTLILPWSLKIQVDLSLMEELRIFKCEGGLFSMPSFPKNLRWLDYIKNVHGPLKQFPEAPENNELVILFWRDDSMGRLPKSFGNLKKLEVLNLQACYRLEELPNSFGDLQSLRNLNLESNGIQSLPESFGMLSNLEVLNLKGCGELVELPNSFGGLQNLRNLNLESSGIQSLPESFGMLSNLEVLNLKGCGALVKLPNSFGGLQNLRNLDLKSSGIQILLESFGMLSNLEVLNLKSYGELVELPNSFGGLQNLRNLDLKSSGIQILPESFGKLSNLEALNLKSCGEEVQDDSKASSSVVLIEHDDCKSEDFMVSPYITKWIIYGDMLERTLLCFFNIEEMQYEFYFEDHESMATIIGLGVPHSKVILECGSPHVTVVEIPKEDWDVVWTHSNDIPCSMPKGYVLKQELFPDILHRIANIINTNNIVSEANNGGGGGDNGKDKAQGNADDSKGKGKAHEHDNYGNDDHSDGGSNGSPNDDHKKERKGKDGNDDKNNGQDRDDEKTSNDLKEVKVEVHLRFLPGGVLEAKGKEKELKEVHEEEEEKKELKEVHEEEEGEKMELGETHGEEGEKMELGETHGEEGEKMELGEIHGEGEEKRELGEIHGEEVEEKKKEREDCKAMEKKKMNLLAFLRHALKRGKNDNVVENQQERTIIEGLEDGDVDMNLKKQVENQIHSKMEFTFTIKNEAGGRLKTIQATIRPITFQLPSSNEENYLQRKRFGWFHDYLKVAFGVFDTEVAYLDEESCKVLDPFEVKEVNLQGNAKENTKTSTDAYKGEMGIKHGFIASGAYGRTNGSEAKTTKEVQNTWETKRTFTQGGFLISNCTDHFSHQLKYSCRPLFPFDEKVFEGKDKGGRLMEYYQNPICQLQQVRCQGTWHPYDSENLEAYKLEASRELRMTRVYNLDSEIGEKKKKQKGVWKAEKNLPLCFIQKLEKVVYLNHSMSHLTSSATGEYRLQEKQDQNNPSTTFLTQAQYKKEPKWPRNIPLVDVKQ